MAESLAGRNAVRSHACRGNDDVDLIPEQVLDSYYVDTALDGDEKAPYLREIRARSDCLLWYCNNARKVTRHTVYTPCVLLSKNYPAHDQIALADPRCTKTDVPIMFLYGPALSTRNLSPYYGMASPGNLLSWAGSPVSEMRAGVRHVTDRWDTELMDKYFSHHMKSKPIPLVDKEVEVEKHFLESVLTTMLNMERVKTSQPLPGIKRGNLASRRGSITRATTRRLNTLAYLLESSDDEDGFPSPSPFYRKASTTKNDVSEASPAIPMGSFDDKENKKPSSGSTTLLHTTGQKARQSLRKLAERPRASDVAAAKPKEVKVNLCASQRSTHRALGLAHRPSLVAEMNGLPKKPIPNCSPTSTRATPKKASSMPQSDGVLCSSPNSARPPTSIQGQTFLSPPGEYTTSVTQGSTDRSEPEVFEKPFQFVSPSFETKITPLYRLAIDPRFADPDYDATRLFSPFLNLDEDEMKLWSPTPMAQMKDLTPPLDELVKMVNTLAIEDWDPEMQNMSEGDDESKPEEAKDSAGNSTVSPENGVSVSATQSKTASQPVPVSKTTKEHGIGAESEISKSHPDPPSGAEATEEADTRLARELAMLEAKQLGIPSSDETSTMMLKHDIVSVESKTALNRPDPPSGAAVLAEAKARMVPDK